MTAVFCIIAVVALISIYDYLSSRSWQLVTSDIRNEVVFENRNKKYGAFMIRQDYNRNMVVIMTSIVFGTGVLYAAYAGFRSDAKMEIALPDHDQVDEPYVLLDPILEPEIPETPKKQIQSSEVSKQWVEPKIVDKKTEVKTLTQEELDRLKASSQTNDKKGDGIGTTVVKVDPVIPEPVIIKSTDPVLIPDVNAEYPGGFPAMAKFIQKNLSIPDVFIENGTSGKVYLRFVVGVDGEISSVRVMRGLVGFPECEKAAMKVVKSMPKWKPGQVKGENVSTYFDLPINFEVD